MPKKDPRVDDYLARSADFARPILTRVRNAFHGGCSGLEETIKWGVPCFQLDGRILGGMAAFKAHVSWGLWDAAGLDDPEGLFRDAKASVMNAHPVGSASELPKTAVLRDYVKRAAELRRSRGGQPSGTRRKPVVVDVPPELAAAFRRSAKAKRFFDSLPPSHRREYCEWIAEARRDETKARRTATAIEWLAEGKRRNWKYEGGC